jgi:DNA-binding NarL/FixJ family response regulator
MSTKIILVDDHQLIREGFRALLEKDLGMEVIGEADDGATAIQIVREQLPDIVIMDVAMPGFDGISATRRITDEFPSIKVIALSMYSTKLFVMDMFEAGASGYLLKECASMELEHAINAVLANEIYLSPKVTGIVLDGHMKRPSETQSPRAVLTEKECKVLQLLANGRSTKEIALTLKKSVQTIDTYRRQIMNKLNIHSVAELTKYAVREGLTTLGL